MKIQLVYIPMQITVHMEINVLLKRTETTEYSYCYLP